MGDYIGTTIGVIQGDTRSLDSDSHDLHFPNRDHRLLQAPT